MANLTTDNVTTNTGTMSTGSGTSTMWTTMASILNETTAINTNQTESPVYTIATQGNSTDNFTSIDNATTISMATPTTLNTFPTANIVLALLMALIVACSVIFNVLLFIVFGTVKKVRKPKNWFIVNLAATDILGALFWSALCFVGVVQQGWTLGDSICKLQVFVATFLYAMNMHTIVIITIERCIMMMKPSKHREIFNGTVVCIIVIAIWIFDVVVAMFPIAVWGETKYHTNQFQCAVDAQRSPSQLNFYAVVSTAVPVVLIVICWILMGRKLRDMRRRADPFAGEMIAEENLDVPGETWGDRYRKQQKHLQAPITSSKGYKKNRKLKKHKRRDSSSDSSSEEDRERDQLAPNKRKKRTYKFQDSDLKLALVMLIVWGAVLILWLPYWIVNYVSTYSDTLSFTDGAVVAFVWLAHCTVFIKPPLYCMFGRYLDAFKERFGRKKKATMKANKSKEVAAESQSNVQLEGFHEHHRPDSGKSGSSRAHSANGSRMK